jgi:hypothetical protein
LPTTAFRNAIRIATLCGALILAGQVSAAPDAYATGDGSPNFQTVTIQVTATVTGSCGFAPVPLTPIAVPNVDLAFNNVDSTFGLNCNGASNVAVVSQNGGMLNSGTAPSGYANLAPYDVALHLAGDGGLAADGSCAVATLTASAGSPCSFRGPATTSQGLKLNGPATNRTGSYLRISAPVHPVTLIAGAYTDVLTVTVSAAI